MTLQDRDTLTTTINTNIPTNTTGGVTATNHRQVEENLADGIWGKVETVIDDTDSPYTLDLDATQVLSADPSSGAIVVNLPALSGVTGKVFWFMNTGGTNNVTLTADGSDLLNGSGTYATSTQYDGAMVVAGAAQWWVYPTG